MGDDPPPLIASAFKEYTILGALKTDLQGLVYWWERHQEVPRTLEEGARGLWHLAALVNHADILFTGKRRPDSLEGAVFRTLRDLGVPELGDPFRQALSAPASAGGLSLDKVIKRMRNAFAHRGHDLQQHGDDFAFWGLSQSNASFQAFSGLIGATRGVLEVIEMHMLDLVAQFVATGTLGDLDRYIMTGPERAVRATRQRRKGTPRRDGRERP